MTISWHFAEASIQNAHPTTSYTFYHVPCPLMSHIHCGGAVIWARVGSPQGGGWKMRTSVYAEMVEGWNVRAVLKSEDITHKAREEEVCPRSQEKLDYFN